MKKQFRVKAFLFINADNAGEAEATAEAVMGKLDSDELIAGVAVREGSAKEVATA